MITIKFDDQNVLRVIAELQRRLEDMQPAMQSIGEYLVGATHSHFATSTGPDGVPWARNTETTYLRMLQKRQGLTLTKGENVGRLTAKGAGVAVTKKPLIGETHRLENEIAMRASPDSVEIGSNLVYAAVQQFGESRGAAGSNRRGSPIPWGTIPPRPFIGMSAGDTDAVLSIIGRFLAAASAA